MAEAHENELEIILRSIEMDRAKIIGGMLLSVGLVGNAVAGGGYYTGISVGQSTIDICGDAQAAGATNCDDTDTGWKFYGGYDFNLNFALEVGWLDFGEATASSNVVVAGIEGQGLTLDAKGTLPIGDAFGVFAKAGLLFWDADGTRAAAPYSDDGSDFSFGLGAEYAFTDQLGGRLEWQEINDLDVTFWSAGMVLKF